ncbi:MAG TPA: hypothetical protein VK211_25415, partial [Kamptonema sp.]|nr:hypothetical protein [Kamptonema sp.]
LVILYLIVYSLFLLGGWIPVAATILAFLIASASVVSAKRMSYIYEVIQLIKWIHLKNQSTEDALREHSSKSK